MSDESDVLAQAVRETIAAHPDAVARWMRNEAGAWGFLAGQGVLTYRRLLGRRLSDAERRALWHTLWTALDHTL